MRWYVKTDVTSEPITIAEAKLFCKITGTGDDALIAELIRAARETIEEYCGITISQKTLVVEYDKLPRDGKIFLPYGPVSSGTAIVVKTIDEEDVATTLVNNTEWYDTGYPWPTLRIASFWSSRVTRVQVEYVAGYGISTYTPPLPAMLKVAIMKEILTQYDIRENISVGNAITGLSNDSKSLCKPYIKKLWFAPDE